MKKDLLYKDLAKYYDLIYHWKDYKKEAADIIRLISKYKESDGNDLVELACGTGRHMQYLKKYYNCIGTDINEEILREAKKRNKDVKFLKADMINLHLNKNFDIILCLFSSIGYVKTYKNLERTIKNISNHLKHGGVVIIEPWFNHKNFDSGKPTVTVYDGPNLKMSRLNTSYIKNNVSILDMHYLIAERGKNVKHFIDRHELGLFDINKTLRIMRKIGLKAKYIESKKITGRGAFVGIKK